MMNHDLGNEVMQHKLEWQRKKKNPTTTVSELTKDSGQGQWERKVKWPGDHVNDA